MLNINLVLKCLRNIKQIIHKKPHIFADIEIPLLPFSHSIKLLFCITSHWHSMKCDTAIEMMTMNVAN